MSETEGGKIYQKIPAVMGDMNAVGKNKTNKNQGFQYRGIDDVMNAVNPALVKHNVFIVPEIIEQTREERNGRNGGILIYSICRMRFRFCAEDGSFVEAVTAGEGMDSGDKATNKAMAAAFKYACFQIFCIPTEEMKDPDEESPEAAPKKKAGAEAGGEAQEEDNSREQEMAARANASLIDQPKTAVIRKKIMQKGLSEQSVLDNYGIKSFSEMTFEMWTGALQILDRYEDK